MHLDDRPSQLVNKIRGLSNFVSIGLDVTMHYVRTIARGRKTEPDIATGAPPRTVSFQTLGILLAGSERMVREAIAPGTQAMSQYLLR